MDFFSEIYFFFFQATLGIFLKKFCSSVTYRESPPISFGFFGGAFLFFFLPACQLLPLVVPCSGVVGDWSVNPQPICSSCISLFWWICAKSGYLALDILHCAMFFHLVGEWKNQSNSVNLTITKTVVSLFFLFVAQIQSWVQQKSGHPDKLYRTYIRKC